MFSKVKKIIRDVTGIKNISMDTDFIRDLMLNSFDIVNLVTVFEQRFNIEIPMEDVWDMYLVKDVVDYLEKKGFT